MLRGFFYRLVMRVAHRFNWHYAPPIYPENDVQLWCKWCGFRMTLPRAVCNNVWGYIGQEAIRCDQPKRHDGYCTLSSCSTDKEREQKAAPTGDTK